VSCEERGREIEDGHEMHCRCGWYLQFLLFHLSPSSLLGKVIFLFLSHSSSAPTGQEPLASKSYVNVVVRVDDLFRLLANGLAVKYIV
jgi:hypothetical protein